MNKDKADIKGVIKQERGIEKPEKSKEASREIGGRKGPDPIRYGDWELNGKCVDF